MCFLFLSLIRLGSYYLFDTRSQYFIFFLSLSINAEISLLFLCCLCGEFCFIIYHSLDSYSRLPGPVPFVGASWPVMPVLCTAVSSISWRNCLSQLHSDTELRNITRGIVSGLFPFFFLFPSWKLNFFLDSIVFLRWAGAFVSAQ